MSTPAQFSLDISKFAAKAKGNMDKAVRKIVLDIGTRIVMRSPVGDDTYWKHPAPKGYIGGRFRANWQYGYSVAPQGALPDIDPTGAASIGRISDGIGSSPAAGVHFLSNNLPYAQRLESGWSTRQAPAGMVGVTVVEFQSIVANAAKSVNP
jgi:hypothetical protein